MGSFVDLNSDVGESFGNYKLGLDEEVLNYVTSANIACGWHAGDPLIMEHTIKIAVEKNLGIGAHPGYPDLLGFGRRNIDITPKEAKVYMLYQLGALHAFAQAAGAKIQHVKLHGAFYNTASAKPELAEEIINGILEFDKSIILLALSGSHIAQKATEKGLRVAQEVFADRAYNADGTLVSRKLPGSMIHDKNEAISRVKKMVLEGKVISIDGKEVPIAADSICVHGDNPEAVNFVSQIKNSLEAENIVLKPLNEFI